VTQPKQEIGVECVRSLLSLIKNKGSRKMIQKVLRSELIVRQSTGGV
jgi:DNA-binding LacI/PurR family transcriptional regulator